jgi:hypothetical protein
MRGLKFLVVAMGVLILAGLATIAVTIVHRMGAGKAAERPVAPSAGSWGEGGKRLALPAGSRVAGMAIAEGRLVLRLEGPGAEQRLLLVDLATGASLGSILLDSSR